MEINIKEINLIINILSIIKNGEEYYVSKENTPDVEYARIKFCAEYIKENNLVKFVGIFIDGISIQIINNNGLLFLDKPPTVKDSLVSKVKEFFGNYYVRVIIILLITPIIIWLVNLIKNILKSLLEGL